MNRIHPDTTRAWDRWHDHTILERTLRVLERRLGLREVDGHLHQLEGQRAPERHEHVRRPEFRHEHEHQHTPDNLGAEGRERVNEAKRRIYDADLFRHLDRLEFECARTLEADGAMQDRLTRARRAVDGATRAFYGTLEEVYARAPEAMKRFDDVLYSEGPGAAIHRLRDDPTSYVELRPYARSGFLGLWHRDDDTTARELMPRALDRAGEYTNAVAEMRHALRQLEPSLSRADQEHSIRAETELAAHLERAEREHGRLRRVRDELQPEPLVRHRARAMVRDLRPRELAHLHHAIGSAAMTLAVVLQHRLVRDIAVGREIAD